ncbi:triose-phosphate isomerase [Flavobacteriaceae bacterium]|nr:triose-phosphate isomerase [Flavobacteriaceae bacterium]MDA9015059.1 triose-phosphate isomerase [Flavobacteriaceae bacterium]
MRNQIVAGNWKMNNNTAETQLLLENLMQHEIREDVSVYVAPAFTQLFQSVHMLELQSISVAAQNMNAAASGAHTGEVSSAMLKGVGVNTVILGHSERRSLYGETDDLLKAKVATAIEAGMEIMFCFGEELSDRKENKHFDLVKTQLASALFDLPNTAWSQIILAYEPVWAIGTGETASPEQAQEMHAFIRQQIESQYDAALADRVSILYGGSVKPNNAKEIFSMADVDGGLIGGASLNAEDFMAIVNAF